MPEFTANYGFIKPDFNISGWHEDVNGNYDSIDALLFAVVGLGNFVGQWTNSTNYTAQQRVFDPDNGSIWNCIVDHTSASTGSMSDDRLANPTFWSSVSSIPIVRGAWANDTVYASGDIVYDTTESLFCIAAVTHTSMSTPNTLRDDLANWDVIADLSIAGVTVSSVNSQIGAVVLDSDDISDTTQTHKFATALQLAAIGTNTAAIAALDTRLDTAEADIVALEAADTALDTRVDTAEADISALETLTTNLVNGYAVIASGLIASASSLDLALDGHTQYKTFKLILRDIVPASDGATPGIRGSDDGGGTFEADASDYKWVVFHTEMATANNDFSFGDGADSRIELSIGVGSSAGEFCNFEITLDNPQGTTLSKLFKWEGFATSTAGEHFAVTGTGMFLSAAAMTDIRFLFSSGNIASGSYTLIGIK
jgi:hypothetical protein